ncbi:hypothetical protein [Roseibium sp.]|uniref:hypothetical protein n=1 Tax=Roseibium sp. TaxID=1936156 RepID=UPI003A97AC2B
MKAQEIGNTQRLNMTDDRNNSEAVKKISPSDATGGGGSAPQDVEALFQTAAQAPRQSVAQTPVKSQSKTVSEKSGTKSRQSRDERLAEALRVNLRRRKAAAKSRRDEA